jgi:UDP-N-acetylmuramoyl-tripeptide--D-alanyl-D-alanine ligase
MYDAVATRQEWRGMAWTLTDLIDATGARGPRRSDIVCTSVSTDSRRLDSGAAFIALRGPFHDGHRYVAEALRRGAVACIVEQVPPDVDAARALVVPDTLRALGDLAAWTRRREPLRVAAITGSNGKTTTKEMLAAICERAAWPGSRSRVLKTVGTENNLVGVPLTLLRMQGDEVVAVLEMGMNAPGEIARLADIAAPDIGVITNVGPAHLEGLGSIAGVAAAKGELFAHMPADATIAVNMDDEWVRRVAADFPGTRIEFGAGREIAAVHVVDHGFDGTEFDLRIGDGSVAVRLHLPGLHNISNALAAAAVAHGLGLDREVIRDGLAHTAAPPMRMQVLQLANGITVLNDGYNANPASTAAALRFIRQRGAGTIAVLGEMRELGATSAALHEDIGRVAGECGVRLLVTVGDHGDDIARGARAAGIATDAIRVCASPGEAAAVVTSAWRAGDAVLVKGSRGPADDPIVKLRGSRMAEIVRLLTEAGSRA